MIFGYSVVVGVILGLVFRGRLAELRDLRLRFPWAVVPVFPLQVLLIRDPWHLVQDPGLFGLLVMLSYLPLVAFVAANRRVPGLTLAGLGLIMNLLVMLGNGGLMPVSPESLRAAGLAEGRDLVVGNRTWGGKGVILPVEATRLAFLSDIIIVPLPPRQRIISAGDVLTFLGLAFGVQAVMRRRATIWPIFGRSAVAAPSPHLESHRTGGVPSPP